MEAQALDNMRIPDELSEYLDIFVNILKAGKAMEKLTHMNPLLPECDCYLFIQNYADRTLNIILLDDQHFLRTVHLEKLSKEAILKAIRDHWQKYNLPPIHRFYIHKTVQIIAEDLTNADLIEQCFHEPPLIECAADNKLNRLKKIRDISRYMYRLEIDHAIDGLCHDINCYFNYKLVTRLEIDHYIHGLCYGINCYLQNYADQNRRPKQFIKVNSNAWQ